MQRKKNKYYAVIDQAHRRRLRNNFFRCVDDNVPWVPEIFRGPLRDLPADEAARKPLGKSGLIYCSR